MHTSLMILALGLAIALRYLWQPRLEHHLTDWRPTLTAFLIPPLVMLSMAIAVVGMGTQGTMFSLPVGGVGYGLGGLGLGIAGVTLLYRGWLSGRSLHQLQPLTTVELHTPLGPVMGSLLPSAVPFAGQVGFWTPRLVISQGLLDRLSPEQLQAVLAHEQAHHHYRDTFLFFWLGWVRSLTAWLPKTDVLWQELLLLRELRADRHAAHQIDPLILAEALFQVTQQQMQTSHTLPPTLDEAVALNEAALYHRLETRITRLLEPNVASANWSQPLSQQAWKWVWLLLPLLTICFHQ